MELQSYLQKIRSVGRKGVRLLWILLSYATQSFLYKQATISLRLYSPDLKVSKWHYRPQFYFGSCVVVLLELSQAFTKFSMYLSCRT